MSGSSRGVYAILAHDDVAGLTRTVKNVRSMIPGARLVLFNGGCDPSFGQELDLEICPDSKPLDYGRLSEFHLRTLRWLHERGDRLDFVMTLEPDVAIIRAGVDEAVGSAMASQEADYLGPRYWVRSADTLPIGMTMRHWEETWQPLLGTDMPSGCMNPAQVFGATFIERLMALARLDEIEHLLARTHVHAMEEVVWPTLAAATGCRPGWPPYSEAIRLERYTPQQIRALVEQGVHLMHKVGTAADDPDRQIVNELTAGRVPDYDGYTDDYAGTSWIKRAVPRAVRDVRVRFQRAREARSRS